MKAENGPNGIERGIDPCERLPSQSELNELLLYDPLTGQLTWRRRKLKWFENCKNPQMSQAQWNARFSGKETFTSTMKGYPYGTVLSVNHLAHRVIWKMVYGDEPISVDHINGIPSDNRLSNLRAVTHAENMRNVKLRKDNKTGIVGVSVRKDTGKYTARIKTRNGYESLGSFPTLKDAKIARELAALENDYHPNHGRERYALSDDNVGAVL